MAIHMKEVGSTLKELREGMGLSQTEVSAYLGVDQSLVSKFESGERAVGAETLNQLSALFCCPVSDIVSAGDHAPQIACSFRANMLGAEDLKALAVVNRIALNQLQMDTLAGRTENVG